MNTATVSQPPVVADLDEDRILVQAQEILKRRLGSPRQSVSCAADVAGLLTLHYAGRRTEAVTLLLLDSANGLIDLLDVAEGTVDGSAVYPREVVREVIANDATGVILAHNHPSGRTNPSEADRQLTRRIGDALRSIDVRLLDHVVVGGADYYSFADHREASLAR